MRRSEIESLLHPAPTEHPGWSSFCEAMKDRAYGYDPIQHAWAFFSEGWEMSHRIAQIPHAYATVALEERVRIAEAIRDDARASSQKYLDEKRAAEADVAKLRALMQEVNGDLEKIKQDLLKPKETSTVLSNPTYGCGLCSEMLFDHVGELMEHTRKHHTRCLSFHWQYRCDRCEDHAKDGQPEHRALGDDGTVYTW